MRVQQGIALICATMLACPLASAQDDEHPFIRSFTLSVVDDRILVAWTMVGGSTCDGSEVLRSTNGVDFSPVHRIDGICGDEVSDVPFAWWDEDPPEFTTVHYRIKLGNQGYSSIQAVDFLQLTTSEQRFFPSPTSGKVTLVLNVPASARVDLRIMDAVGRSILEQADLIGPVHELDLGRLSAGTYVYLVLSEGRRFVGRFIKE